MTLKLQIVKDGEVVIEIPLSPSDWPEDLLEEELASFAAEFQRFSRIFNALSNETRLMMMKRLLERRNRTANFSDFMKELHLNPKLVWENTRILREGGLVQKIGRGRYRCSEFGETSFMIMSLGLRRLIDFLHLEEP